MPRTAAAFDSHREYTVEARRSGGWWALSIPDLPGVHSQVRRLGQADEMIRDAIALAFDISPDEVKVSGPIPIVNPEVDELLKTTRATREQLAELRVRVDTLSRKLAHDMADEGIPVRDIAQVLDVSFQHAAKLAKQAQRATTASTPRSEPFGPTEVADALAQPRPNPHPTPSSKGQL